MMKDLFRFLTTPVSLIVIGLSLNTINYKMGYIIPDWIGWVIVGAGVVNFFINAIINYRKK